jgi:hypothetical protein
MYREADLEADLGDQFGALGVCALSYCLTVCLHRALTPDKPKEAPAH